MIGSEELLAALRQLKDDGKTTNAELARILGLPSSRIAEVFDNKRKITIDEMKKLVEAFDLIEESGPSRSSYNADNSAEILALDLSLSMGPGTMIDDYVEATPVIFDLNLLRAITRTPSDMLRMVRGIGDSMYPTLHDNDPIMIDTTVRQLVRQDGIYWINIHGAAGIKRLRTIGANRILIVSDNPAVDNYEVDGEDLRIEGRVIWYMRGV